MKRALLLDFDGVVLRKHQAHNLVGLRCQNFVQRQLKLKNPLKAREMNVNLYRTYGHTLMGLRKLGYDIDLEEFNQFVYTCLPYHTLFKDVCETNRLDIRNVERINEFCLENDIDVYLFSNAPDVWCHTILDYMRVPLMRTLKHEALKPDRMCFQEIHPTLQRYDQLVFVDDSFINFHHVLHSQRWLKILASTEMQDKPLQITESVFMVYDLLQCMDVIKNRRLDMAHTGVIPSERELFTHM